MSHYKLQGGQFQVRSAAETFLESENAGKLERERDDPENRACEISLARLSPRLPLLCGGNSSDIYLWWILWDEQIQNKKELIRLASAGMGGLFFFVWRAVFNRRLLSHSFDLLTSLNQVKTTKGYQRLDMFVSDGKVSRLRLPKVI